MNTPYLRTARSLLALAVAIGGDVTRASAQRADSASVVVSRRELRVVYPRDTVTHWGWSGGDAEVIAYRWALRSDAIERAHSLALTVTRESEKPRTFASLRELLAGAEVVRCDNQGMVEICAMPVTGSARVERGRVVLVVRDSALIMDLFGLRPTNVALSFDGAAGTSSWRDSVRVRYTEPAIAPPSDSLRAWVASTRRLAAKRSHRVSRILSAEGAISRGDTIWVTLGDTVDFEAHEVDCQVDVCTRSTLLASSAAVWAVSDTTVLGAVARQRGNPLEVTTYASGRYRRVAKRVGIAALRVSALDPYRGDTALVLEPPPVALAAVVVVRRRVARLGIHSRPDTIRVGAEPLFSADAFDAAGALLPRVPVAFVADSVRP